MTTIININGQQYDASTLTLPASGRVFRDAWDAPINSVIQTDPVRLHAIMALKVQDERLRRLQLGFDHDFGDGRGVHRIGTTDADMEGWRDVTDVSNALIATSNASAAIDIVTDTGSTIVTALEWQQVLITASSVRQQIWGASFVLQAMDPIPSNYADNSYWIP